MKRGLGSLLNHAFEFLGAFLDIFVNQTALGLRLRVGGDCQSFLNHVTSVGVGNGVVNVVFHQEKVEIEHCVDVVVHDDVYVDPILGMVVGIDHGDITADTASYRKKNYRALAGGNGDLCRNIVDVTTENKHD